MSSWRRVPSQKRSPATLIIESVENSGFFSCCSVRLQKIIEYYNGLTRPPTQIDSSQQFLWYKPADYPPEKSIVEDFFLEKVNGRISYTHPIKFQQSDQFTDYRNLPLADILPFVRRYFTISATIEQFILGLEQKYLIDYKNTCVLFYKGGSQIPYEEYLAQAKGVLAQNPKTLFLIQSDETEFIEAMSALPQAFYFIDEIRSIPRCSTHIDTVNPPENYEYALHFLAIMIIMSRCRDVVFGSSNCSLWLVLFRGGTAGIQQHLGGKWLA
jgi:hypothetical protein